MGLLRKRGGKTALWGSVGSNKKTSSLYKIPLCSLSVFSPWTTFWIINILTGLASRGSPWEFPTSRLRSCTLIASRWPLAYHKCPIKCKWHLQRWIGSLHLSVDWDSMFPLPTPLSRSLTPILTLFLSFIASH